VSTTDDAELSPASTTSTNNKNDHAIQREPVFAR